MVFYILQFYKFLKQCFKHVIHTRRLIISSEKRIIQFTISVPLQLTVLSLIAFSVLWSSYTTGHLIAANSKLEAQSNTIRSVITKQFSGIFNFFIPTQLFPDKSTISLVNIDAMNQLNKNYIKMAELEKQVNELKIANDSIVERVRIKTGGQLDSLESIVNQTGLDPESMKKKADKSQKFSKQTAANNEAEGGPYIPTEMPKISDEAEAMLHSLDELQTLRKVVANLPLGIPIKNAEERSRFGHRIDPFNGDIAFHSGLDLAAPSGTEVHSTADGKVITAGREGSYGNMIDIDHGFGIITRYGHLSEIKVQVGDRIKKGSVIGVQGSTGRSTGDHLHYEVRFNGEAINPQNFLQTGRLLELGNGISQN